MPNIMRVVLATDHAGFKLKETIKQFLMGKGIDVIDEGTFSEQPVDYPSVIRKGCAAVLEQKTLGIIFGGSGNGEAMAANKVRGIRAAVCWNTELAKLARAHNDANVLSMGARFVDEKMAMEMVEVFLETKFEGGRHLKRIEDLESND
jgi:ribose 5-phosphate isomerase B